MQNFFDTSLGKEPRAVVSLEATRIDDLFRGNAYGALHLFCIVYRSKAVGEWITVNIIEQIGEFRRAGVTDILPFRNERVSDANV